MWSVRHARANSFEEQALRKVQSVCTGSDENIYTGAECYANALNATRMLLCTDGGNVVAQLERERVY